MISVRLAKRHRRRVWYVRVFTSKPLSQITGPKQLEQVRLGPAAVIRVVAREENKIKKKNTTERAMTFIVSIGGYKTLRDTM